MAERQSIHRQGIERIAVLGDLIQSMMGTVLAYIAFGISMAGAVLLALYDKPLEGLVALVSALGTAFGPKIFRKWQSAEESKD